MASEVSQTSEPDEICGSKELLLIILKASDSKWETYAVKNQGANLFLKKSMNNQRLLYIKY